MSWSMAHRKRRRLKHRHKGCLLCKPQKLTANVKGDRHKELRAALEHEPRVTLTPRGAPAQPLRDDARIPFWDGLHG